MGELQGLEFAPERGGIGSVIGLAMAKQVYQEIDHFTTWLVGVLQKFWQFQPGDCEDTLPTLSCLDYQSVEKRISLRDRDRLGNDPHWVPGFLSCCTWMFPEQVRTCGFRRNSSSFDRAPKIRDFVRLNSFESFLVTVPSIFSETWEMYSWAIFGSSVFCISFFSSDIFKLFSR